LKDIHFFGQGSRKRSLQNVSKDSTSKRTAHKQSETIAESIASHSGTVETLNDATAEITSQPYEIAKTTSETCSTVHTDTTSQAYMTISQSTDTTNLHDYQPRH